MRNASQYRMYRLAYYCAFGSAVTILFSIALSQVLLALSLAALLLSGEKLRFPPFRLPLAVFFLVTLFALLASGDPQRGTPQVRKFFVFAIVLVICSTFDTLRQVRALVFAWAGAGSVSALMGLAQFLERHREALQQQADSYGFLLDGRITGFASHWMTFGGEEMIVFLLLLSFLLFAVPQKIRPLGWLMAAILAVSLVLGMTRSVLLLGVPAGLICLLWRRRGLLLAAAVIAALGMAAAPRAIRERVTSSFAPHSGVDSNARHAVCLVTGWEMVKAHPWLGLGPEQIAPQFDRYVPPSVKRRLHGLPAGWYGHLHNIYLQYAAERGIFGLLSILWLIATVLLDFRRNLKRGSTTPEAQAILRGGIAVIVAVLMEGMFEYNLGDSEVLTLFLAVVACGYVAIWHVPEAPHSVQSVARRQDAEVLA